LIHNYHISKTLVSFLNTDMCKILFLTFTSCEESKKKEKQIDIIQKDVIFKRKIYTTQKTKNMHGRTCM